MKMIRRFCLDLFFPNRCPFCNHFLVWDKLVCDSCLDEISYTGTELCSLCGKNPCICGEEIIYDRCYTACYYEGVMKEGIYRLKTANGINASEFFGEIISEKILGDGIHIDYVVPVPMGRKKKRERGYNQAEEIARHIAGRLNVPVMCRLLHSADTPTEQHSLNASERKVHAQSLYSISRPMNLAGKTILLCDDVLTTGSTMNACSVLLKSMGAGFIVVAAGATTSLKY